MTSAHGAVAKGSGFFSRRLADERVLLGVFVLYLFLCTGLLLYLRHLAVEHVRVPAFGKARADARQLLQAKWETLNHSPAGLARWLTQPPFDDVFDARAERLRHTPPGSELAELQAFSTLPYLDLAISQDGGRVFLLRQRIEPELVAGAHRYERLYVLITSGGLLLLGLVAVAAVYRQRARRDPAQLSTTQQLARRIEGRPSRWVLAWIAVSSAIIFLIDLQVTLGPAIGALYVLVVVGAQWSSNRTHTWVAAALGTVLIITKLIVAHRIPDMWPVLANRTLAIFIVWTVAVVAQWQKRALRSQARALEDVRASRASNRELKAALARTEAVEAQLRREQQVLDTVARIARIGSWELDPVAMRPKWSQEVYRIHDITVERDVPFDEALLYYPDEARTQLRDALNAAIFDGEPFDLTLPFVTAKNRNLWVRVLGTAEQKDGRTTHLTGAIQDITESHLMQARLSRTIRGTQDGMWEQDLRKGRTWVSPRFFEMLGYPPRDIEDTAKPLEDLLSPEDLDTFEIARMRHLATREPFDIEVRLRTQDGTYRWMRIRAAAEFDKSGRATLLSGSIRDKTREREAEQALIAAKEASAEASRTKGAFLANMSHEIRTPMNGVLGMTELLLETSLTGTQREFAETIRSSATALLTVLNDILDFSKIEAGKLDLERIPFDIRHCVEDVGRMMAVQASKKKVELMVSVDPAVPDQVIGDPHRLRQVLVNLCSNALKFTSRGEVVIEVFPAGVRPRETLVHFEVRDTGIGMDEATLERLFQPFTQADASTTRHFGGTGLGLSIVSRLIELMQGRIQVQSAVGRGSTFFFTLPLEPVSERSAESATAVSVRGKRVLVVDDNATNRRLVRGQLEPLGLIVATASGGAEALESLRRAAESREPFHLALVDDEMPDERGTELGKRLRSNHAAGSSLPLILLTSLDRAGQARELDALGFDGYLVKPVRGRELRDCVLRVFEQQTLSATGRFPRLVTRAALVAEAARPTFDGHVLLVEDNEVNQRVGQRFLERLGCRATVAEDGNAALVAWRATSFDLILMDVQMPVKDGLTATREIRAEEGPGRRIPIVALTASAMSGDLQRCLDAGMDGLLSKPLEEARLRSTLERFGLVRRTGSVRSVAGAAGAAVASGGAVSAGRVLASGEAAHSGAMPLGAATACAFDRAYLESVSDGDREFMRQLTHAFVKSARQVLEAIEDARTRDDRLQLSALGHKLKGASQSVGATAVAAAAAELETHARTLAATDLQALLTRVRNKVDACVLELKGTGLD